MNSWAELSDDMIVVRGLTETPYYGSDLEAGYLFRDWNTGGVELRGYLGAYWFDRNLKGFKAVYGPRVRLELRLFDLPWLGNGSRLVASGQYERDRVHGSRATAGLTLRVPLRGRSSPPLDRFDRRKLNPIVRRPGVFIDDVWTIEPAGFPDGRAISAVATIHDNTNAPAGVIENLGPDSVVIVDGHFGQIDIRETLVMKNGQTIIGGGSEMLVVGRGTGGRAWFTAPGEPAEIVQRGNTDDTIRLPQRNGAVIGLGIYTNHSAITGEDTVNTVLRGNTISVAFSSRQGEGDAISLTGSQQNILIEGNELSALGTGLSIDGSVSGLITDNIIFDNQGSGIRITGDLKADLTSNSITSSGRQGLLVEGRTQGDLAGNTSSRNRGHGLEIRGEMTGSLSGNSASENLGSGFVLTAGTSGAISGNTAHNNAAHGILLMDTASGPIEQNVSEGNGQNGLFAMNGLNRLTENVFRNNGSTGVGGDAHGLRVDGSVTELIAQNEIFDNAGIGVVLNVPGGSTVRFEGNELSGNNSGSSELFATRQSGSSGTAFVRLRGNVSTNITNDLQFPNFQRFSLLEFIDEGGNLGVIQQ